MLNRYRLTRGTLAVVVAAEDPYDARLVAQKYCNMGRSSRAWMSAIVTIETLEVMTSDLERGLISIGTVQ